MIKTLIKTILKQIYINNQQNNIYKYTNILHNNNIYNKPNY
jgi:hypothetical protein